MCVRIALCFPGQGSHEVGMGRAFAESVPAARAVYDQASEAAGLDLARLCFEGPLEELTETEIQQPALTATSLACFAALEPLELEPAFVVGHSAGEYAALGASGALVPADAVRLVRERGLATAAAARHYPGAMAAVIGLDDEVVEMLCAEIEGVWLTNYNCPGQIVVSGIPPALESLVEQATAHGGRVVRLRVTGAFHSPLVASAAERLRGALRSVTWNETAISFMSTVTAAVEPADRLPGLLVEQLTMPVRFTQAISALVRKGVELFVEVGPGHVLAGLIRRIDGSVETISVGDPKSLARLEETVHGR
jgi:[acyl-carrier-protein] S-malonyltransferase